MIEFKGKITGKALIYQANQYKKIFSIALFISSLLVCLLYGLFDIIILVSFIILAIFLCPAKVFGFVLPNRVFIDLEDRTIVSESKEGVETFRMIDDIVEVKDHGEFYSFKFNSIRNQYNFIAQKDLITQGTIEEFEMIFEEVLVRVKK